MVLKCHLIRCAVGIHPFNQWVPIIRKRILEHPLIKLWLLITWIAYTIQITHFVLHLNLLNKNIYKNLTRVIIGTKLSKITIPTLDWNAIENPMRGNSSVRLLQQKLIWQRPTAIQYWIVKQPFCSWIILSTSANLRAFPLNWQSSVKQ
jgi:hypothetical protein